MGSAVCYGPGAISMKENWVQGAPLHLHTQLHISSEPYTTAAVKDCPLQSSLCAVYHYPSPWYGVQNAPVGQRVKGSERDIVQLGFFQRDCHIKTKMVIAIYQSTDIFK